MSVPKNLQFILHYPEKVDFSKSDWDLFSEIKALVQQIKSFKDPKILSEQYSLPNDLISFILISPKPP